MKLSRLLLFFSCHCLTLPLCVVLQLATATVSRTAATSTRSCSRARSTAATASTARVTGTVPTASDVRRTSTRERTVLVWPATATRSVSNCYRGRLDDQQQIHVELSQRNIIILNFVLCWMYKKARIAIYKFKYQLIKFKAFKIVTPGTRRTFDVFKMNIAVNHK